MTLNLALEIERWDTCWRTVTDAGDCERQLHRLYWLSDFAFGAGRAITAEEFNALQRQLELGERKLAELTGQSFEDGVPKTMPTFAPSRRPEVVEGTERQNFAQKHMF